MATWALTEKYVTRTAAGGGDGSLVTPWTFDEAIAALVALGVGAVAHRVNIKNDGTNYSIGATTFPTGGLANQPIVWRGYNSTIGDLDDLGRDANGALVTTNMPNITVTAAWTPAANTIFQNLVLTASINSGIVVSSTADGVAFYQCSLTNSANNASAACVQADNGAMLFCSDFTCSGANHGTVVNTDVQTKAINCRFKGTLNTASLFTPDDGAVISRCSFIGAGNTSIGVAFTALGDSVTIIDHCTFYNCGYGVSFPNSAQTTPHHLAFDNMFTDCGTAIKGATTNIFLFEFHNRTRDNSTTNRTDEIGPSGANVGEITTDTGGAATDYTSTAGDNFTLITTSPGYGTGYIDNTDCGGHQHATPASSGGLIRHPGMAGGLNG